MRITHKKILRSILVIHGAGINLIGAVIAFIVFQPQNYLLWGCVWLASFQLNVYWIYWYKKRFPEMVDEKKNLQYSPWLTDLFSGPLKKEQ